jgi:hypothetical protein
MNDALYAIEPLRQGEADLAEMSVVVAVKRV